MMELGTKSAGLRKIPSKFEVGGKLPSVFSEFRSKIRVNYQQAHFFWGWALFVCTVWFSSVLAQCRRKFLITPTLPLESCHLS